MLTETNYKLLSPLQKLVVAAWYNESKTETVSLKLSKLAQKGFFPSKFLRIDILSTFYDLGIIIRNSTLNDLVLIESKLQCQLENDNYNIYSEAIDIYNLWIELAIHELISFILSKCKFLGLDLIKQELLIRFSKNMLRKHSVIVSITLIDDFFVKEVDINYEQFKFNRKTAFFSRQSVISRFFSNNVMSMGDDFYRVKPSFDFILKNDNCRLLF